MSFVFQPWQFYLVILAGWINRQQQIVIEYLLTENRVLRETFGTRRILLNDDQRRRLAVKGRFLGRKLLAEFAVLSVTTFWTFRARTRDLGSAAVESVES